MERRKEATEVRSTWLGRGKTRSQIRTPGRDGAKEKKGTQGGLVHSVRGHGE